MTSNLAERYRRLLRWYPRDYRRERGEELVGMLLELAPEGRRKPSWREAANLFRFGMRCRLGRPASRSVVFWAIAASVAVGLFSAAWASRAAWETARPVSSEAELSAALTEVLPSHDFTDQIYRSPAMFVVYEQPFGTANLKTLLIGDGGEYQLGATTASVMGPSHVEPDLSADTQRQLKQAGWTTYEPVLSDLYGCIGPPCDPAAIPQKITLLALRGDNVLEISINPVANGGETYLWASMTRATPWAVNPAAVFGGLAGAVIGWLVFGWASRRLENRHPLLHSTAKLMHGLMAFFWWLPILWVSPFYLVHHLIEPHPRWHHLWEWLGQPVASLPYVLGCASAFMIVMIAALPRRREGARSPSYATQ